MSKSCSTLVVYWTKPHSNGSPVTAYHVEVNGKRTATVKGGLTEATLTDLMPQTDYKYVTMVTKIVLNIFHLKDQSAVREQSWSRPIQVVQMM